MFSNKVASYSGAALFAVAMACTAACGKASEDGNSANNNAANNAAAKAKPAASPATSPTAVEKPAAPTVQEAPKGPFGTIEGKVTLTGTAPEMPLLRRGSDPACDNGELRGETILADAKGGLANVIVRIKPGTVAPFTPSEPVRIDQDNCMYRPRVSGGVIGQTVEVQNSDKTTHNVHARHLPLGERKGTETIVNRAQPSGVAMSFELGDEPVAKLKCDYHAWMQGYVLVSDNPYFAVTGADGSFTLKGAPAGSQTVEVWHEFYGVKEATVEVAADGSVTFDASFDAAKDDPMATGAQSN